MPKNKDAGGLRRLQKIRNMSLADLEKLAMNAPSGSAIDKEMKRRIGLKQRSTVDAFKSRSLIDDGIITEDERLNTALGTSSVRRPTISAKEKKTLEKNKKIMKSYGKKK